LQDITKAQFFRQTNGKNEYIKQMLQCRSRQEYYRLTDKYQSCIKSKKLIEKEEKNKRFYKETDLFQIKDLSKIADLIFDNDTSEYQDDNIEEELIENGPNLFEGNQLDDVADSIEDTTESYFEEYSSSPAKIQKLNK
jgi:hypothetical protein